MTATEGLTARGVRKTFRAGGGALTALADVDLDIALGEFVCVVGPSGCGKSTLLAILGGLDGATAGEVRVADRTVDAPLENMGFVFQRDLLLEWRTALDNILLQFELRGTDVRAYRDTAERLLALVGLEGFASSYPWQLSGGMRQRVAICRALVHDPSVLFMDEPFGALDAMTREQLNEDLLELFESSGRRMAVFVTHDIDEAVFLADRVLVMSPRPGRVVADHRVDLPRPRRRELRTSMEFSEHVRRLRKILDTTEGEA